MCQDICLDLGYRAYFRSYGLVPALLLNLLVEYNTRVLKGRERSGMERCHILYLTDIAAMGRALSGFLLEFLICFESIFDFVE